MTARLVFLIAVAILIGAAGISTAIALKPTGFERCVAIVSASLERQAVQSATTLDPRDTELNAARSCAGRLD